MIRDRLTVGRVTLDHTIQVRILFPDQITFIALSSNGRTPDSESGSDGSNPSKASI